MSSRPPPHPIKGRPRPRMRPMSAPAYRGSIFGPFNEPATSAHNQKQIDEAAKAVVFHYNDGPVDIRATSEFKSVARRDLEKFTWGRIVISIQSTGGATIVTLDTIPHVEVRILSYIGGTVEIVYEGAGGQRQEAGQENSPGPISFEFDMGSMPDAFEVFARARRGGVAETVSAADETLSIAVMSRFHK